MTDNLVGLQRDLAGKIYRHGTYQPFKISDPKPRDIHKAIVRDRLVHHAIYRILYPYFDRQFIFDSYSCRLNKGTHRAINRFREFDYKVSRNQTQTTWVLKCDIRKFFASVDHNVLKEVLAKHIGDEATLWLLAAVIDSFSNDGKTNTGLPLGNLTSQLLVNVYMNECDQFVKRVLKVKYYIRYADDFVVLSEDREYLEKALVSMGDFLVAKLKLQLHPDKVYIKALASGVDFLGWVHFSDHRVLRQTTKRRMYGRMAASQKEETYQSYRGLLSHGNSWKTKQQLRNIFNEGPSE
ncbi:MAG TPA: reverse transcriptase/maturase family protein [Candidatus Saccharimonadales bacterium]|nr:reverse transcriptase/maturase family protein [Candidatus Saccharimonadales bacterium]